MPSAERASLPGVSSARAHQLVAGGLVAEAVMDIFDIENLQMCPCGAARRRDLAETRLDVSLPRFDEMNVSPAMDAGSPVTVPAAQVALSTASVYPESAALGFEIAARLGYDAVELMVGVDALSQDVEAVKHLVDYHEMPVCAVHAPCLLITQRVWGTDPWVKLRRSVDMARALGSQTVVLHPPFRWQREYVAGFVSGVARMEEETGVAVAVENMYPWRAPRREVQAYLPVGIRSTTTTPMSRWICRTPQLRVTTRFR
ncbi:MAG: TIM barrel protein [Nocardioidaceae bacterium]